MLFNSYPFLFAFLPATLIIFYWLRRAGRPDLCVPFLMFASFAFYAYWKPVNIFILLSTIIWSFFLAGYLTRCSRPRAKVALIVAIAGDLGLLAYFKYFDFIIGSLAALFGFHYTPRGIELPIGISFFTFTQIAYVVDCYRARQYEKQFTNYALFVTVFPHLIAGPIIHHAQMRPQFASLAHDRIDPRLVALGIPIFIIGLAKKVLLADNLVGIADPVFAAAEKALPLSTTSAWLGVVAYSLQIYFDFSGYSDMAVGLGLLFGLRLPVNFDSPYKSRSIIEFWRRWHITLSTWLRDYVYFSLGGNRSGEAKRLRNIAITMLLGGLWHGAGWTFVIWGALHATYIVINHIFRLLFPAKHPQKPTPLGGTMNWLLTMLLVMLAWIFFRAKSVPAAVALLKSIASFSTFTDSIRTPGVIDVFWLALGATLALFGQNTQQIFNYSASLSAAAPIARYSLFSWRNYSVSFGLTSGVTSILLGVLGAFVLASLWRPAIFIYFNF
jgi:alginate O-acetyltransferase complex protein AlgI